MPCVFAQSIQDRGRIVTPQTQAYVVEGFDKVFVHREKLLGMGLAPDSGAACIGIRTFETRDAASGLTPVADHLSFFFPANKLIVLGDGEQPFPEIGRNVVVGFNLLLGSFELPDYPEAIDDERRLIALHKRELLGNGLILKKRDRIPLDCLPTWG